MYAVFRLVLQLIIIIYTQAISLFGERFHLNLQNPFIMWVICVNVLDTLFKSISWIEDVFGIIFFKDFFVGRGVMPLNPLRVCHF